jgi:hypothetical protein
MRNFPELQVLLDIVVFLVFLSKVRFIKIEIKLGNDDDTTSS